MNVIRTLKAPCFVFVINFLPQQVYLYSLNCSYSAAVSPCDNYILMHDSSSRVVLYRLNTWEQVSQWDVVPPKQWKWKKHPVVFGLSCGYVAGVEGQLSIIKTGENIFSCEKLPSQSELSCVFFVLSSLHRYLHRWWKGRIFALGVSKACIASPPRHLITVPRYRVITGMTWQLLALSQRHYRPSIIALRSLKVSNT